MFRNRVPEQDSIRDTLARSRKNTTIFNENTSVKILKDNTQSTGLDSPSFIEAPTNYIPAPPPKRIIGSPGDPTSKGGASVFSQTGMSEGILGRATPTRKSVLSFENADREKQRATGYSNYNDDIKFKATGGGDIAYM